MVANYIKILYKLHFYVQYATFLAFLRLGDSRGLVRLRTLSLIYSLLEIYFSSTAITVCKTTQLLLSYISLIIIIRLIRIVWIRRSV